jgi:SAM-dependent methyltransferase
MNLDDLVNRTSPPTAWAEGDNIPWNEPGFSARMLKEHLSQAHDAASRRQEIIDRQVDWIHSTLLNGNASKILDLGCGPGFYSARLAKLGHSCTGVDFSPASIDYALTTASQEGLDCRFICQDIRQAPFPRDTDLVMLIYGEFNIFRPAHARQILDKAWESLKPGGLLLLEPHTYRIVQEIGRKPYSWYSSPGGLFLDEPHVVLKDNYWNPENRTATIRYYVLRAATAEVTRYAQSYQAYSNQQYRRLLLACGFTGVEFLSGLSPVDSQDGLLVIIARK